MEVSLEGQFLIEVLSYVTEALYSLILHLLLLLFFLALAGVFLRTTFLLLPLLPFFLLLFALFVFLGLLLLLAFLWLILRLILRLADLFSI